jgi:hypothetical protein
MRNSSSKEALPQICWSSARWNKLPECRGGLLTTNQGHRVQLDHWHPVKLVGTCMVLIRYHVSSWPLPACQQPACQQPACQPQGCVHTAEVDREGDGSRLQDPIDDAQMHILNTFKYIQTRTLPRKVCHSLQASAPGPTSLSNRHWSARVVIQRQCDDRQALRQGCW